MSYIQSPVHESYVIILVTISSSFHRPFVIVSSPFRHPLVILSSSFRFITLWQNINLHLPLSTQVLNGYPVGCETSLWFDQHCAHLKWCLAGMLPREWRMCTYCLWASLNPMTGVLKPRYSQYPEIAPSQS